MKKLIAADKNQIFPGVDFDPGERRRRRPLRVRPRNPTSGAEKSGELKEISRLHFQPLIGSTLSSGGEGGAI